MAQDEALNKLKQTAYVSDQMFEEDKKFLADYFYINIDEFDKLVNERCGQNQLFAPFYITQFQENL